MSDSICAVEGCPAPLHGSTYCNRHYRAWKKHGDPLWVPPEPAPLPLAPPCIIDGCELPAFNKRGWCNRHYNRWRRNGDPLGGNASPGAKDPICKVDDCELPEASLGWCARHYGRYLHHGDPLAGREFTGQGGGAECSIPGCNRESLTRGWCPLHYARWRKHGDPLAGRTFVGEPLAYFRAKVMTQTPDCILWPYAQAGGDGLHERYGTLRIDGVVRYVHEAACEAWHGPRPSPLHEVCHGVDTRCESRLCFNGAHTKWGDRDEQARHRARDLTQVVGENHANAKITEEIVRSIRAQRERGVPVAMVAAQFDLAPATVSRIANRLAWKHVS